ncbi:MAG: AMP-binding protein [Thermincola sp.]|jgi:acetyl-CoA synthetase|nr:AMP-binding protein [Thermincola sp.]MDT3702856.1 AMP-binding protein [Thermincola sp.]
MMNYDEVYKNFKWEDVEKEFSWHTTGKVNLAYEAVDRMVDEKGRGDQAALHYLSNEREETYTFSQVKAQSNKFANVLRKYGISRHNRVFILMPGSPEMYFTFLGITKVGATAVPLFESYSEAALKAPLADSQAVVLEDNQAVAIVTTPELKNRILKEGLPDLKHIFIIGANGELGEGEIDWDAEMGQALAETEIAWVDGDCPLMLLYSAGLNGKTKGIMHMHYDMLSYFAVGKYVEDFREGDICWCTGDSAMVTGVVNGMIAPWLHGVTTVLNTRSFCAEEWYGMLSKYKVSILYSNPAAFSLLMAEGEEMVKKYDLSSLRHVLSAGEPVRAEVIRWFMETLNLRVHDTWVMTETGMAIICNFPGMPIKPGSMGRPVPGVTAAIIDENGRALPPLQMGNLAVRKGAHEPWYITGNSAYMDEEGYYFYLGRVDDVTNTITAREKAAQDGFGKMMRHVLKEWAAGEGKKDLPL